MHSPLASRAPRPRSVPAPRARLRVPRAPAPFPRAPTPARPCRLRAQRALRLLPRSSMAVSWLGWALYCNTVQPCLCSTVAIHLSVLRYNSSLLLQYNKLYCNTVLSQLHPSCNTIPQPSSLQYKPVYCNTLPAHPWCLTAIQFPVLQYNFFPCCNTKPKHYTPKVAIQFAVLQ